LQISITRRNTILFIIVNIIIAILLNIISNIVELYRNIGNK